MKIEKILIAPDSFKDSATSIEVADAVESGLLKACRDFQIRKIPVADGGEGTVDSIIKATRGELFESRVHDPLMRPVTSKWGISGISKTAVIEMSAASGIELLTPEERNPWITTTYGTGELIRHALDKGCRSFIVGIGGSATNDGGIGMATALGVKFLDKNGNAVGYGGGVCSEITSIDLDSVDSRIYESEFKIACDVTNPLTGPDGASFVYGPQKGADNEQVQKLDSNLKHLADIIRNSLGKDIDKIPGSGAAGGLGAGFMAFLNGSLERGFSIISEEVQLDKHCEWADLVITGEGKIDFQTMFGKTPKGVADSAKKYNKKVIAIAGTLGEKYEELYHQGFNAIFSIINKPMNLEEALSNTKTLIENLSYSIGKIIVL